VTWVSEPSGLMRYTMPLRPSDDHIIRLPERSTARFTGSNALSRTIVRRVPPTSRRCVAPYDRRRRSPPGVDGRPGYRIEAVGDFLHGRAVERRRSQGRGSGGHVEHCELALARLQPVRHVLNGVLIGKLAGPQVCAATIFVTKAKPALAFTCTLRERMPSEL